MASRVRRPRGTPVPFSLPGEQNDLQSSSLEISLVATYKFPPLIFSVAYYRLGSYIFSFNKKVKNQVVTYNFHLEVGKIRLKSLPRLWVMMCQCRFVTKVQLGGVGGTGGETVHVWGRGAYEKSVKLPLDFAVNLKLL